MPKNVEFNKHTLLHYCDIL